MPPLKKADAKTMTGCRIETLNACYGSLPNAIDWYESDAGGVLCRFGDALLVAGQADFDELLEFAKFSGIDRIELLAPCGKSIDVPKSRSMQSCRILRCVGADAADDKKLTVCADLRRCFEILCESDATFAETAEYLPWLSDMQSRRNAGRANVFIYDGAAVACITAGCGRTACLSSVAVLPGRRGAGLGLEMLRAVMSHQTLRGVTVFTAAQTDLLIPFYQKAGFTAQPQCLIITEKRKP